MENTDFKTALENAFSLFYSTDELRQNMLKPFVSGEYTYATDAYTLIRCKTDKIDFEYENKQIPPKVDGIIPNINISEVIDLDSIDWTSLMNEDETIGDGNDIECGHCNGNGECEDDVYYKGRYYDVEYDCPVCDGSGYEQEEKQIPTGNKTFSSNDMVQLKDIHFYLLKFYKLKKVKDLIGGNIELIAYNSNKSAVLFKVGFLEVIIMPCIYDPNSSSDNVILKIS